MSVSCYLSVEEFRPFTLIYDSGGLTVYIYSLMT